MLSYITVSDLVVLAIGLVNLILWLTFYLKGKQYEAMFVGLDASDYPMGDTYFVGYAVMKQLKLNFKTKKARKIRKMLQIIYEPKYAEYYLTVIYSMQFTMALTILCFAAPMYFLTESMAVFVLFLAGAGVVYYYYGTAMEEKIKKRSEEMLSEFSEVVSKLALLVNSGMILTEAWERVAFSGESLIYQEMRRSVGEMKNGMPSGEALYHFGQRCMLPEIKKFSTTLIQGIAQGNRELAPMLTQQSKEVWGLKKQLVRRQGELANNKLLIPMSLTFIGILIMIMVPIFSNMGM